jgi:hypothetical protein
MAGVGLNLQIQYILYNYAISYQRSFITIIVSIQNTIIIEFRFTLPNESRFGITDNDLISVILSNCINKSTT